MNGLEAHNAEVRPMTATLGSTITIGRDLGDRFSTFCILDLVGTVRPIRHRGLAAQVDLAPRSRPAARRDRAPAARGGRNAKKRAVVAVGAQARHPAPFGSG